MKRLMYVELAHVLGTLRSLRDKASSEHDEKMLTMWEEWLSRLVSMLPSGSGIDNGTSVNEASSHVGKIVLETAYHHMDEYGGYDGWTNHTITITPTFGSIYVRMSGPNRNQIKDYLFDTYHEALNMDVSAEWTAFFTNYKEESTK